jgi:cytochrome b pre-mRNA-processing protein 3
MGIVNFFKDLLAQPFDPATARLYNSCVTASRQPAFYTTYAVPDTVDGRFDMLLLHAVLVMLRLKDEGERQKLFDHMFLDMDRSLREMGVGDMGMKRKMKPMLKGFYGRATTYREALAQPNDDALRAALARNLYGAKESDPAHVAEIAAYTRRVTTELTQQSDSDLENGIVIFPVLG